MAFAVFPCNQLWPLSTDPKHLFLVKALILTLLETHLHDRVGWRGRRWKYGSMLEGGTQLLKADKESSDLRIMCVVSVKILKK
jgi:hypothetical protein